VIAILFLKITISNHGLVMNAKITKRLVDATQPENRDVFVWDSEVSGFGLKVTPRGSKKYIFQYRMGGRGHPTRRYTIGSHGVFTPDEARDTAIKLRAQVSHGIDPLKLKAEQREEARKRPRTLGPLADRYISRECPKLARGGDIASIIHREILPRWKDRPIAELRKRDAIALTDCLLDADKPAAALKAYEVIKRLGNWLVERDEIEVSPFTSLKPPTRKTVRDRHLKPEEIAALWSACEVAGYPFGPLLQLLLLIGQRRNEVAGLQWGEMDLEKKEWVIPAARSKNAKAHLVPLSDPAIAVIEKLPRFNGLYIFSTTDGRRPVSGFSKAKRRIEQLAGIDAWRIHDLRRTCRTGMAALGVPEIVAEQVLNHQPQSLVKIYNVHEYSAEKRKALAQWAHHVQELVTPTSTNVLQRPTFMSA
jgi:integrase